MLSAAPIAQMIARPLIDANPQATFNTVSGYTPAQIRHGYGFDRALFNNGTIQGDGTGQTIAIIDAYDDTNIINDVTAFDRQFGLAGTDATGVGKFLTRVAPQGKATDPSGGWQMEMALDVEWAHAMAPGAKILLVEAKSASLGNLIAAVDYARRQKGVSAVSMSWGATEFSGLQTLDSHFTSANRQGITFIAAAGDNAGAMLWPAVSSHVLAVGGTTLNLDSAGNYLAGTEAAWSDGGGGTSQYSPKPAFQNGVNSTRFRMTPDVAFNADPATGFAVYSSVPWQGNNGWFRVGGTSAGAPQWASLLAIANQGRALSGKGSLDGFSQVLPAVYHAGGGIATSSFHDITSGSNGNAARAGFDAATGQGTPFSDLVIADLLKV